MYTMLWMIETLRDFTYQSPRNHGSIVYFGSCRICTIKSRGIGVWNWGFYTSVFAASLGGMLGMRPEAPLPPRAGSGSRLSSGLDSYWPMIWGYPVSVLGATFDYSGLFFWGTWLPSSGFRLEFLAFRGFRVVCRCAYKEAY